MRRNRGHAAAADGCHAYQWQWQRIPTAYAAYSDCAAAAVVLHFA